MVSELLPEGWRWVTLEDIADPKGRAIVSGPFGSNIGKRFFVDYGVAVIRGSNLTTDMTRFIDDGFVFVTEEKADELSNCEAVPDDLVFTAAGSLGQVGIVPRDASFSRYIISNKQLRARVDQQRVEPLFAFYWFSSPHMVAYIQQRNTGSSVPLINLGILRSLPMPLPPLQEQQAIVRILGTLDDKIELNRRMNETLEGIARAIFKSWFVDFGPVRAKAVGEQPYGLAPHIADLFPDAFEESELGEIPKGWQVGTLGTITDEVRDTVRADDIEDGTPYIALQHMPRRSIALHSWDKAEGIASAKHRFNTGDILFGKLRPYFHKVGPAPLHGICSTDIVVCRPKDDFWYGLALGHLSSDDFVAYTDAGSTGTKMPRTNYRYMSNYRIALPSKQVAARFSAIVEPMISRIRQSIFEQQQLAELRDALLPQLISGQIRVSGNRTPSGEPL